MVLPAPSPYRHGPDVKLQIKSTDLMRQVAETLLITINTQDDYYTKMFVYLFFNDCIMHSSQG